MALRSMKSAKSVKSMQSAQFDEEKEKGGFKAYVQFEGYSLGTTMPSRHSL